jgi:hypothetical protein
MTDPPGVIRISHEDFNAGMVESRRVMRREMISELVSAEQQVNDAYVHNHVRGLNLHVSADVRDHLVSAARELRAAVRAVRESDVAS